MSLSAILETAIGLVLIYYALGLIVNLVVGSVKGILDMRAEALEEVLKKAFELHGDTLFDRFSANPMIQNLKPYKPRMAQVVNRYNTKVSEIPGGTFSLALIDELSSLDLVSKTVRNVVEKLVGDQSDPTIQAALDAMLQVDDADLADAMNQAIAKLPPGTAKDRLEELSQLLLSTPQAKVARIRAGLQSLPDGPAKKALLGLLDLSQADFDRFRQRLEGWYDDTMKNVSLLFTQRVRVVVVGVSLVVAFGLGTDSIHVAQALWAQPTLRAAAVEAVPDFVDQFGAGVSEEDMASLSPEQKVELYKERVVEVNLIISEIHALAIPATWWQAPIPATPMDWLLRILGLLITTAAISQGSSFWYDILRKINPRQAPSSAPAPSSE